MHKLVRDLIPEVIPKDKLDQYEFSIAEKEQYHELLRQKLLEEIQEFLEEENIEELADCLEVFDAFIELKGFDRKEIEATKQDKKNSRGGFGKGVVLKKVAKC